ncbi:MAG TPA: alpha/beta fold hydrolase [Oculatellaceae cyanobacterium]|jgi:non-heme chloroperoxidase
MRLFLLNWFYAVQLKLHAIWVGIATLLVAIKPTPHDPMQEGWNAAKQTLLLKNGLLLKYIELGLPEGEVVIFLHGITASSRAWSLVVPYLSGQYRLYCLDFRGHGDSDKPRDGYTIQALAEDVIEFMDGKEIAQAHVVGHSLGGFVCQYLAVHWPERVKSVALIATALKVWRNRVTHQVEEATQPVPLVSKLASEEPKSSPLNPTFLKYLVREALRIPIRVWRQGIRRVFDEDFSETLKAVRRPALIIWGRRDPLFDRASQTLLRAALPHAVIKIYENAGHNPHYQLPERLAEDLRAFLEFSAQVEAE